jgi:uncharacterized membrane protein YbaN (DUF454 family)
MRLHHSQTIRWIYASAGVIFVIVGGIGAVLPLLPTTVFMLLAAACFARSSPRFYQALINNKSIGPVITEWEQHRCMPRHIKKRALVLIFITFSISITFFAQTLWLRIVLALLGITLLGWIARIPSRQSRPASADA